MGQQHSTRRRRIAVLAAGNPAVKTEEIYMCSGKDGGATGKQHLIDFTGGRSVWPHADVVPRRVVVAGDEGAPPVVALHGGAPHAPALPPHDLRVVPAHPAAAAVAPVVVLRLLRHPRPHRLRRRPPRAAAPEQVLPVGTRRVHQRAVAAPGLRVRPRVPRHALVPHQRRQPHRRPHPVLRGQELPLHVAAAPAAARVAAGLDGIAAEEDRDGYQESHAAQAGCCSGTSGGGHGRLGGNAELWWVLLFAWLTTARSLLDIYGDLENLILCVF